MFGKMYVDLHMIKIFFFKFAEKNNINKFYYVLRVEDVNIEF